MTKTELRKFIKEERNAIPSDIRQEKSALVCEKLFDLPKFSKDMSNQCVMSFFSFGSEIDTSYINREFMNRQVKLYLPRVRSIKNRTMDIVEYTTNSVLVESKYGIFEPLDGDLIQANQLDVIIVPALAFDKENNRLGYGGGFYDSILCSAKKSCLKVGLCFKEQMLEKIPVEGHDEVVSFIIHD